MMVNVFALITALIYIINVPLTAKISLFCSGDINVSVGAFSARGGININTDVKTLISGFFKRKKRPTPVNTRALIEALKFKRIRIEVSLPDACYTALAAGAIAGALSALGARNYKVAPAFSRSEAYISGECIISLTMGQAFKTVGNIALGAVKESMKKWNKKDR